MNNKFIKFIRDSRYAFIISLVALGVILLAWISLHRGIDRQIEKEFIALSEETVSNIENQTELYFNALRALRGFYVSSEYVSRDEWQIFTKSNDLNSNFPGIQALEYVEKIDSNDKNDFIKRVISDGFTDFKIKSESDKKEHFIVNYIEPFVGNEYQFGLDLSANNDVFSVLENSRDTNKLFVTKPFNLVQNDKDVVVFLASLPVYKKSQSIAALEERRSNLNGFVTEILKPELLFNTIKQKTLKNERFLLSDDKRIFFDSGMDNAQKLPQSNLYFNANIEIGGRTWFFESYPSADFITTFQSERDISNLALIYGILFVILLFIAIFLIFRSRRLAVEMALTMTMKFNEEKAKVDKINKDLQSAVDKAELTIIERDNQQVAILNILEDIEEEKNKTEVIANDLKKFQLAVNNASDQIVITDPEGIILHANDALERITGFKVKEVLGKKVGTKELWGGKMSNEFYHKLWKTIKTDKKAFSGEILNHRKNGVNYDALASITPVLDKNSEVIYFVAIEKDITKEKEVDRMKTELVSVASHQLRTPLTAIRWYVEEVYNGELGKLTKEQKDYLKQVLESNERMIRLVNDLLNVSRLESGRVTVEPTPTNLIELVDSVIVESNILAQTRNCKLEFIKPKGKLQSIKIDPSLIRQVVNNLVSNAIKYSKPEGEKSSVIVELSKDNQNVIISVKDNGIGIPKDLQHRIFDKFFRADNAVKTETEGTGLGLYISKLIVESSGGKIWFESNNSGTTFTFNLPLSGSKEYKGEKGLA